LRCPVCTSAVCESKTHRSTHLRPQHSPEGFRLGTGSPKRASKHGVGASYALTFSIAYLADALEFVCERHAPVGASAIAPACPQHLPFPTLHQTEGTAMGTD